MRRLPSIALLALVLVLALAVTACGGDDESSSAAPVDEWAEGFCTAVSSWTDELRQIGESISNPSSLDVDALKEAGNEASDATETFVDDIRALDAPDTESGEEIRTSVETLADTLDTERSDLSDAVDGVESLTDLPAAISAIGTALTAMASAFQDALNAIDDGDVSGELETAFESSDACDDLTS